MSKFEENIRKAFEQASMAYNEDAWKDFDQKLDQVQMQDLLFTEKLSSKFNFAVVPYSPEHWDQIKHKVKVEGGGRNDIDRLSKNIFEDAVYSGPVMGWDKMSSMLDEQDNGFESKLKEKFENQEIEYNDAHWKDLVSRMDDKKPRLLWAYISVLALGIGVASYMGLSTDQVHIPDTVSNQDIKVESQVDPSNGDVVLSVKEKVVEVDNNIDQASNESVIQGVHDRANRLAQKTPSSHRLGTALSNRTNNGEGLNGRDNGQEGKSGNHGGGIGGVSPGEKASMGGSNAPNGSEAAGGEGESAGAAIASISAMEEVGVPFSEPLLEYQFTKVDYPVDQPRKELVHAALLPQLRFWDNAGATGIAGEHNASVFASQDYKILNQYGEVLETEWNQPLVGVLGYEYHSVKRGLSVGTYLSNKSNNTWNCSAFNVTVAQEKEWSNLTFRFAGGLSANRNQVKAQTLEFTEFGVGSTTQSQSVHVAPETFVSANAGLMVVHQNYYASYNVSGPVVYRINYENESALTHDINVAGTMNIGSRVQASALCNFNVSDTMSVTPGLAVTKDNRWLFNANLQDLKRYVFGFGVQEGNIRTYVRYGHVNQRETGRIIRDLFAWNGTIVLGFNYTLK